MSELIKSFSAYVASMMDWEGVYPHPAFVLDRNGQHIVTALDLSPEEAIAWFWQTVTCEEPQEVMLGLDRTTQPDQGTEFGDVLTCVCWKEGIHEKWARSFKIGVINYQHEPRIVRAIDWDNTFWIERMTTDLLYYVPKMRIKTRKVGG